jgi:RES domain
MAPEVRLRLPEPGFFEDLLRPTRTDVAWLMRLSRHPATEPCWSPGVYRFDDPDPGGADAFGTCHTASTIEVAFAETVIHACGRFVGGSYEVPAVELTERSVVRFACERRKTLVLADLTGAALKALGLSNDISASADYAASQAWVARDPRRQPALGRDPLRIAADEQGLCLRYLRAQRASQAARREARVVAGG